MSYLYSIKRAFYMFYFLRFVERNIQKVLSSFIYKHIIQNT